MKSFRASALRPSKTLALVRRAPVIRSAAALTMVAAVAIGIAGVPSFAGAQSATTFSAGDALVVNTDALNLRAAASISGTVDTVLYTGEATTIVSGPVSADGYDWYQVSTASGNGYVDGEYLGATLTYSASVSAVSSGGFTIRGGYVVNTDALNLRDDATISANVSAVLATGDAVTVESGPVSADGYDWYQVSTASGAGWVDGEFLATTTTLSSASDLTIGSDYIVNTDALNLRADASASATIDTVLVTGDYATIVSGPNVADGYAWYQVTTSLGTGWVAGDFLTLA